MKYNSIWFIKSFTFPPLNKWSSQLFIIPHALFTMKIMKNIWMSQSIIFHSRINDSFHEVPVLSAPFLVKRFFIKTTNFVPITLINTNQSKAQWFPFSFWGFWSFPTTQADDNGSVDRTTFKAMLWNRFRNNFVF